jgi:hypothetical protein
MKGAFDELKYRVKRFKVRKKSKVSIISSTRNQDVVRIMPDTDIIV